MKLSTEKFERIEAYLMGNLVENERELFEAEIEQDSMLKDEIRAQKRLRLGLDILAIEYNNIQQTEILKLETDLEKKSSQGFKLSSIEQRIKAAHQRHLKPETTETVVKQLSRKKHPFSYTQWATAASIVFLLGFGWFYRSEYYIPSDAMAMTEKELAFSDASFNMPDKPSPANHIRATQKAAWFLAMTELKKKNKQNAKKILKTIAGTPGHLYEGKAKTMLEKL